MRGVKTENVEKVLVFKGHVLKGPKLIRRIGGRFDVELTEKSDVFD